MNSENILSKKFPELAKEWHPSKNGLLTPNDISYGTNKIVWWKCEKGHEWESSVKQRSRGIKCPYCSGKFVSSENNLSSILPQIASQWHPNKNNPLTPFNIKYNSAKKVWWICEKGHEWKATPSSRNRGTNCPYCSNKKVNNENSFGYKNQNLIKEWHPTKNGNLTPFDFTYGSGKKVWWICDEGHEYEMILRDRDRGYKCPFCSNQRICKENSLKVLKPKLANEWNFTKNENLKPDEVTLGSSKKVWWKCDEGHEWEAIVSSRTRGSGCPYCTNKKVNTNNCLAITHPTLVEEWHFSKNNNLTPYNVTYGSSKKVWWKCEKGHEYQTTIHQKSVLKVGCTVCNKSTSFPEQAIYYYIKKFFKHTKNMAQLKIDKKNVEADVYIPELNIVIEYDGFYFHRNKFKKEEEKNKAFISEGLELIRIREKGLKGFSDVKCLFHDSSKIENINIIINEILNYIVSEYKLNDSTIYNIKNSKIDILRDENQIRNNYMKDLKEKSFIHTNPELVKEWDFEKNRGLNPEMFTRGSDVKVSWICEKGHGWVTAISKRTIEKTNCPYCTNQLASETNNLLENNPFIAKQWHSIKNGELKPTDVTYGSGKKVWWICEKGHEWISDVRNRVHGNGCPHCSGRKVSEHNNLSSQLPHLAKEWHPTKNEELTPNDVVPGSNKKIWWMCEKGHEWEAVINSRTSGRGCPYCSGRFATMKNCLSNVYPELAKEWHPTKNEGLTPNNVTKSSNKKIWWKCMKGHEWKQSVNLRTKKGEFRNCPYCTNKRPSMENNLEFLYPFVAKMWHPTKNGHLLPKDVLPGSHKEVWWLCELGHVTSKPIRDKVTQPACKICKKKKG